MTKQIGIITTILILVSCTSAPPPSSQKLTLGMVQSTVVRGANQTQITKTLGAPNIISRDMNGNETWTYDRISRDSEAKSASLFSIFNPIGWLTGAGTVSRASSSTSSKSLTVVITFDENKNVLEYAHQSLSF